jgi:hypothetical protein
MKRTISSVFLAVAMLFSAGATAQVTVLTHAMVIDGTGAGAQKDLTIVIENGRIRDMGPSSKVTVPAGAMVVDLSGKFVVPGSSMPMGTSGQRPSHSYANTRFTASPP